MIVACWMIKLLDYPEHQGYQMGFFIGIVSALGFADTLVNDILADDMTVETSKRWRNIGFMLLAMGYAASMFFLLQYREPPYLIVARMVLDAMVCVLIAFAGLGEVLEESTTKPRRKP
jgi:drug/metabolite transporter (DMT)-like permease